MAITTLVQTDVLKRHIVAAGIPNDRPVKVRLHNVEVSGGRQPAVYFCNLVPIELLEDVPDGLDCPQEIGLQRLLVRINDRQQRLNHCNGFCSLVGTLHLNGCVELTIEDVQGVSESLTPVAFGSAMLDMLLADLQEAHSTAPVRVDQLV